MQARSHPRDALKLNGSAQRKKEGLRVVMLCEFSERATYPEWLIATHPPGSWHSCGIAQGTPLSAAAICLQLSLAASCRLWRQLHLVGVDGGGQETSRVRPAKQLHLASSRRRHGSAVQGMAVLLGSVESVHLTDFLVGTTSQKPIVI